jgi:hypothetical protein
VTRWFKKCDQIFLLMLDFLFCLSRKIALSVGDGDENGGEGGLEGDLPFTNCENRKWREGKSGGSRLDFIFCLLPSREAMKRGERKISWRTN